MLGRVVLGISLLGLWLPAPGQTKPAVIALTSKDLNETKIYEAFFHKALAFGRIADQMDAQGRSGAGMRSKIVTEARLTSAEAAVFNSAVAEWQNRGAALDAMALPVKKQYVTQAQSGGSGSPALLQQLIDLQKQHDQLTDNEVKRIKAAFGDFRFFVFDGYVRRRSTAQFFVVAPPSK